MKKDISIPVVKDVFVAVVKEWNSEYEMYDWNAYIINNNNSDIDAVIVVSHGYNTEKVTSKFRHMLGSVPSKSSKKIEFIQDKVLGFNNEFAVTYFLDNQLFDKKFLFRKNTINDNALRDIPCMDSKGILVM